MKNHISLLPPAHRSRAISKIRGAGFCIVQHASPMAIAKKVAHVLKVPCPAGISDCSDMISKFIQMPDITTPIERPEFVPLRITAAWLLAEERARNPLKRYPGDGR